MGLAFSNLFVRIWGKKDMRLAVVGFQNAGKTTLINKMEFGQPESSTPISGLDLDTIQYKSVTFKTWDSSSNSEIQHHCDQYLTDAHAIVFVVDSNDHGRIPDARAEIHRIANNNDGKPILVFANKQDCDNALGPREIIEKLQLDHLNNRPWFIQVSCATSGDGISEGLAWVANTLRKMELTQ